MGTRQQLHDLLLTITDNVYFQPPSSGKIVYPCIIYNFSDENVLHADDKPYKADDRYQVTLITKDPDNTQRKDIRDLPKCRFDRFFTKDNLNHYTYDLYF